MEPLRPLIADQAVLGGVNNGQVKAQSLMREEEGLQRFANEGRRLIIDLVEKRMTSNVSVNNRSEPVSYRAAIGLSARALANSLRAQEPFAAMERP